MQFTDIYQLIALQIIQVYSSGYRLRWSEPSTYRNTPFTTWKVLSNVCFVPLSQGYAEGRQKIQVVLCV